MLVAASGCVSQARATGWFVLTMPSVYATVSNASASGLWRNGSRDSGFGVLGARCSGFGARCSGFGLAAPKREARRRAAEISGRRRICSGNVVQPRTHHPDPYFVADYAGGSLPFVPLTVPLDEARRLFMTDFSEPSSIRVFGKSLHWLAAGWTVAIWWLWLASINQSLVRRGVMPDNYALSILIAGLLSALAIEAAALMIGRWTGRAPRPGLE